MNQPKLIRPKVSGAWKMPNIGLNDVVDLMDFFGFEVEISIKPKDEPNQEGSKQ